MRLELDIVATRGDMIESRHRVHAAVADHTGALRASAGDPAMATVMRSCAKPFQAFPFVDSGAYDELAWTEEMLAMACASHGGEPEHIEIVSRMLGTLRLEEGDLACGAHEPLTRRGQKALKEAGESPTRLHNNCSGKHAAMLALAQVQKWPTRGYEQCVHPVQQHAVQALAKWCEIEAIEREDDDRWLRRGGVRIANANVRGRTRALRRRRARGRWARPRASSARCARIRSSWAARTASTRCLWRRRRAE